MHFMHSEMKLNFTETGPWTYHPKVVASTKQIAVATTCAVP